MDYPKFIVSNQKEESISIQKVKPFSHLTLSSQINSSIQIDTIRFGG